MVKHPVRPVGSLCIMGKHPVRPVGSLCIMGKHPVRSVGSLTLCGYVPSIFTRNYRKFTGIFIKSHRNVWDMTI